MPYYHFLSSQDIDHGLIPSIQDPRQFVPPTGQEFTTLAELKEKGYHNVWKPDPVEEGVTSIFTEPKVYIP